MANNIVIANGVHLKPTTDFNDNPYYDLKSVLKALRLSNELILPLVQALPGVCAFMGSDGTMIINKYAFDCLKSFANDSLNNHDAETFKAWLEIKCGADLLDKSNPLQKEISDFEKLCESAIPIQVPENVEQEYERLIECLGKQLYLNSNRKIMRLLTDSQLDYNFDEKDLVAEGKIVMVNGHEVHTYIIQGKTFYDFKESLLALGLSDILDDLILDEDEVVNIDQVGYDCLVSFAKSNQPHNVDNFINFMKCNPDETDSQD